MANHNSCRRALATIAAALIVSLAPPDGATLAQTVQRVRVESGVLQGSVADGLTIFRGIPYAAPPVGSLRWQPPRPALEWDGGRTATEFGRACMQSNAAIANLPPPSEDCLFVNVWTPATRPDERLPVMVWIHGGGFVAGTPAERLYHGEWLAKKGVVVVSIAYRVGVFGFLAHAGLSAESEQHVSGNYGLLDTIAGLRWVQKNVHAFGGDPARVTIFGESAGAIAVSMLCASPLAKGLFRAAISQSGGSFGPVRAGGGPGENMRPLKVAEQEGAAWAESIGTSTLRELRQMPADKLLDATRGQRATSWPVTDGWIVPGDQYTLYEAARYHDVPVLIGYNSDEGATFGAPRSQEEYVDRVRQRYGPFADKLLAAYPGGETPAAKRTARNLTRDTAFGWHTWTWARLQHKTGTSKVFAYYFDEPFPPDAPPPGYGTPHAEELPYVFRQLTEHDRPAPTPRDEALSELMRTYWTNFAKTGNPNGPGAPAWPAFTKDSPHVLHIASDRTKAGAFVDERGLEILDEYFAWRRLPAGAPLRAGAAKVDVTPAELPKNVHGVLDRLYSRAIVLENGATRVALVTVDAGVIPEELWQAVTARLESELQIPRANVLLTATHTHSAPRQTALDYTQKIVESVRLARQNLSAARVGYATGVSYINVNRQIVDPKSRRWREGPNYDGPSDKTVAVLTFQRPDGTPIAVYYNYAVHAVIAGQLDEVSADIPGAASAYIEDSYDGSVVAVWSTGAAGDQNPIYFQQTYDLRDIRARAYAKRGVDISNSMLPGGEGLDRGDPAVAKLMTQQRQMLKSTGQFVGEEVLHVMRGITSTQSVAHLFGGQATIQCPGRERTNEGRAGAAGTYKEGPPVDLKLSLLRIGDVMIGGVNAEVFGPIAQRLKRESSIKGTMMATLTNGMARSGYIADDASYTKNTFEVLSSRLQQGCAESAIVNGILDLIERSRGEETPVAR